MAKDCRTDKEVSLKEAHKILAGIERGASAEDVAKAIYEYFLLNIESWEHFADDEEKVRELLTQALLKWRMITL